MKTFIFLDIDGVANTIRADQPFAERYPYSMCASIDRDKIERLMILAQAYDAEIILSSSWRYLILTGEMTLAGFEWMLRSQGFHQGRLTGHTGADEPFLTEVPKFGSVDLATWVPPMTRGQQIADYLAEHPCDRYVVIDDLDLGITAYGHPFIQTNPELGFTDRDLVRADMLLEDQTFDLSPRVEAA